MRASLQDFVWTPDEGIYVHPDEHTSRYSDGQEVEERILSILKSTEDRSSLSTSLQSQITDWASEYHFTPSRHLLLRHLPFGPSDKILELGCGCGAITRFLGETGAEVHSIEDGPIRAQCASARCAGLDNVKVFCADMRNVDYQKQYDYVLLIGVLEYSPIFFPDEDPIEACLKLVRCALKDDGKAIIAIENRLGLKYFMGLTEDHTNISYYGIHDLYTKNTACTLGKKELAVKLAQAGFQSLEFQYPFPDYKLPVVLLTDLAFETDNFYPGEIVSQTKSRDYLGIGYPTFLERLAWPKLDENALTRDLANSFLVIAGMSPHKAADGLLAAYYNVGRKLEYQTSTLFVLDEQKRVNVRKERLSPGLELPYGPLAFKPEENSEYVRGTLFEEEMLKAIVRKDLDTFRELCMKWLDFLKEHVVSGSGWSSILSPDSFDYIPRNLILVDGNIKLIDREWQYKKPLTLDILALRGMLAFQMPNYSLEYWQIEAETFGDVLKKLLGTIGLELTPELVDRFAEAESAIQSQVSGGNPIEIIRGYFETAVPAFTYSTKHEMNDKVSHLKTEIHNLSSELDGIYASKAWRILTRVRLVRRAIGRLFGQK
jgi:SAM-dependent methyltransferase